MNFATLNIFIKIGPGTSGIYSETKGNSLQIAEA